MKEKKHCQMRMTHRISVFLLLLFAFAGILPGTKAQAQEPKNNLTYTFTSTHDEAVSTKANPGETTVLVFGYVGCSKTRGTLDSVSSSEWVKRSDIRVVFADTKFHTKEEVQVYENGYQCPNMTFCYDESEGINRAVYGYSNLFGMGSRLTLPVIVLIDKNNKVQNILTGENTADAILSEIKKFENIDEGGSGTPPSDSDSGIPNFAYGLKTIENTDISTKANPGQATVLVFGYTTCGKTKGTLSEIDKSAWVGRSDIRVVYVEVYGASLADTKAFAQTFSSGKIIFCHDEASLNFNLSLSYLALDHQVGGECPYIVLIDGKNKVRSITLGPKTAEEIYAEIEAFTKDDGNAGGGQKPGGDGGTGDVSLSVADVSGLKAESAAKSVKLTWDKVSNASGYAVYQYNASKKAWTEKATVGQSAASYTVKGLSPGTAYRFAVRAFVQPSGQQPTYSKSYAALDTGTAPNAVSFKVKAGKKKATLTWRKVKGAAGYTVYYKTKAKGAWKKLKSVKGTSYTKTKLKSKTTYYFTVKAYKKYKSGTATSSFQSKKVKVK